MDNTAHSAKQNTGFQDLDNQDYSRLFHYEHVVAVACVQWRKAGSNNYPLLLENALGKLREASKINHEQ